MTEKKSVRDEPWVKNAPDYMVEVVVQITEARDDCRKMMELLNAREARLAERELINADRESAVVQAAADIRSFANQVYGPDSELSQIKGTVIKLEERVTALEKDRKTA